MKKKLLTLSLAIAILAIAITGGTLAYFTDTEARANVFTSGNIEIALHESNNDDDPTDGSYDYDKNTDGDPVKKDEDYQNWLEAIGQDQNELFIAGRLREKDVWVENLGDNPMYTRLHIGVPANVYDSAKDAADHIIAMTFNADNGSGWTLKKVDGTENSYYEEFFGVEYYVMVFTYENVVEKGTQTPICLSSLQMLTGVDCSHKYTANGVTYVDYTNKDGGSDVTFKAKEGKIPVLVAAEAGQILTFEGKTAQEALDTQFGTPATTAEYVSPLVHLFDANGELVDVYEDN